jgi:hypothetical protein
MIGKINSYLLLLEEEVLTYISFLLDGEVLNHNNSSPLRGED